MVQSNKITLNKSPQSDVLTQTSMLVHKDFTEHVAKLLYFTNLGFPEIEDFPY